MPVSTISRTPASTSCSTSARMAAAGRLVARPRATCTMQYVQALSQPSCTFTPTRVREENGAAAWGAPSSGAASLASGDRVASGVSSSRKSAMPAFGTTRTRGLMSSKTRASIAAAQPVTMTSGAALSRSAWRTALRVFFSASPVTVHVLTTTTSASTSGDALPPRAASSCAKPSDSTRLTLQPRLTIENLMRACFWHVRRARRARRA